MIPNRHLKGNWLVWTTQSAGIVSPRTVAGRYDVYTYDLTARFRRRIEAGVPDPYVGVDRGIVFFTLGSGKSRDIYGVPADGSGSAVRYTSSGNVGHIHVGAGALTWGEPANEFRPTTQKVQREDPTAPAVTVPPPLEDYLVPGDGFIAYPMPDNRLYVRAFLNDSLGETHVVSSKSLSIGAKWTSDGKVLLWTEAVFDRPGGFNDILHVGEALNLPPP